MPCTYPEMKKDKTCKMKKNTFKIFKTVQERTVEKEMKKYYEPVIKDYGFGTGMEPLFISIGILCSFIGLVALGYMAGMDVIIHFFPN